MDTSQLYTKYDRRSINRTGFIGGMVLRAVKFFYQDRNYTPHYLDSLINTSTLPLLPQTRQPIFKRTL